MTDLEAQRLTNLKNKEKLLADLNLNVRAATAGKPPPCKNGVITKRRRMATVSAATRSSARLRQAGDRPSYKEDDEDMHSVTLDSPLPKRRRKLATPSEPIENETPERPQDIESMREGWSNWEAVGVPPRRDEYGTFHFEDHPLFLPNKSPEEMIREGCFGGSYWRPLKSRKLGIVVQEDWKELPKKWIDGLDVHVFLTSPNYDADVNKYKVACGQSIEEWEASGWIIHEYDVRGWFQWYCRFFQGRRCADDGRQVSRWRKCVGPTGRWRRMLLKTYLRMGVRDVFDDGEDEDTKEVSPVMHQTCHHWAFEVKQHDLDEVWQRP